MVSVINITGSKDCIFQDNSFVRVQSQAMLIVGECVFHSYNHAVHSAIDVDNSTLTLSGTISFINNTVGSDQYFSVCGGAISFNSGYSIYANVPISAFNISARANVSFTNNSATKCGGALYLRSTIMNINNNAYLTLAYNCITILPNYVGLGGAMCIVQSKIRMKTGASLLIAKTVFIRVELSIFGTAECSLMSAMMFGLLIIQLCLEVVQFICITIPTY